MDERQKVERREMENSWGNRDEGMRERLRKRKAAVLGKQKEKERRLNGNM